MNPAQPTNYERVSVRLAQQLMADRQEVAALRIRFRDLTLAVEEGKASRADVATVRARIRELEEDIAAKEAAHLEARDRSREQRRTSLAEHLAAKSTAVDVAMAGRVEMAAEIDQLADRLAAICARYDDQGHAAHSAIARLLSPDAVAASAPTRIGPYVLARLILTAGWSEIPGIVTPSMAMGASILPIAPSAKEMAQDDRARLASRFAVEERAA